MDAVALERVSEAFQDFHDYFAPDFGRREAREHSRHYLQALLVQSEERRNAENLSETVPASPRALQRFLAESPWDDDAVIDRLQEYLGSRLEDPQGVWVLDGSDFPKQGVKSVGVARQYCGALGKIANCQAGVFLAHVGPKGRALVEASGCICPRSGLGTGTAAWRRGCQRTDGGTEARRSWPWRWWRKPRPEDTSRPSGWPAIQPSGCLPRCGRDWRQRECCTSWTCGRI